MRSPTDTERERWRLQEANRISRAIGQFRVHKMNNTKWREVFALLVENPFGVKRIRLKFVGADQEIETGSGFRPIGDSWCDGFPGPFEYRELEWLEVPREYWVRRGNKGTPMQVETQDTELLRNALSRLGKLPIADCAWGFRIVAYE